MAPFVMSLWGGFSPDDLVVDVETDAATQTVLLPLKTSVNVVIDWGDGSAPETVTTDDPSHEYAVAGSYTIVADGVATVFGNTVDTALATTWTARVVGVQQWGTLGYTTFTSLFRNVTRNVLVPSNLPTTVRNMRFMFGDAAAFNRDISAWDTKDVTNMYAMFINAIAFNQPIGSWNIEDVTTLGNVLHNADVFDQDLSSWNTAGVTDMLGAFYNAEAFNQDISAWDYRDLSVNNRLDSFLSGATAFSPTNYGLLLARWAAQTLTTPAIRTDLRPTVSSQYPSSAATDRATLVTYGWTITDLGQVP